MTVVQNPLFITSCNSIKKRIILVAKKKSRQDFKMFVSTIACKISLSTTVSDLPRSSFVRFTYPVSNFAYQRQMVFSFTEPFLNVALMIWAAAAA